MNSKDEIKSQDENSIDERKGDQAIFLNKTRVSPCEFALPNFSLTLGILYSRH
jgi:hypothetical protein